MLRKKEPETPYGIKKVKGTIFIYGQMFETDMYEVYADYSFITGKKAPVHVCKCLNEENANLIKAILDHELKSIPYKPENNPNNGTMPTINQLRETAKYKP